MTWSNFLADGPVTIVVDTSVVINLNATGRAGDILGQSSYRFVTPEAVRAELVRGEQNGHTDAKAFEDLCSRKLIEIVELQTEGLQVYESLIDGSTARTLDDGEAATIGCAIDRSALALIDDRKARRLCADFFPSVRVGYTVEFLLSDAVRTIIGEAAQAEVIFQALTVGRMRVPIELLDHVRSIIGSDRAALCPSLPLR